MNAPTLYAWLPGTKRVFNLMFLPGVIMGAAAAFLWFFVVLKSRRPINGRLLLEVSLVSLLVVPLFLPKMHDRYFYPADVLSIAFAFLYPAYFYVPLLVGGVSFLAYQPFLFERDLFPLPVLTLVLTATTAILAQHTLRQLFASSRPAGATDTAGAAAGPVDAKDDQS
jgi:Gpi18-like mannosyltransferase